MDGSRLRLTSISTDQLDKNLILHFKRREGLSSKSAIPYPVKSLARECEYCGSMNREAANYCLKCGKSIVQPPTERIPPAESLSSNRPLPQVSGCFYHPTLPAQYGCADCRVAICIVCARNYYGSVYCPICYSRRIGTWLLKGPVSLSYSRSVFPPGLLRRL